MQWNIPHLAVHQPHTAGDTRIDDEPSADEAGRRVGIGAILGIDADDIDGPAIHFPPGSRDDGILLGMHCDTQLVAFALRHALGLSFAVAAVAAVHFSAGGAVVAGRDDFIVVHDDGPIVPAQASAPLSGHLSNAEIVAIFADSFHWPSPP